jgi:hypothetical protein
VMRQWVTVMTWVAVGDEVACGQAGVSGDRDSCVVTAATTVTSGMTITISPLNSCDVTQFWLDSFWRMKPFVSFQQGANCSETVGYGCHLAVIDVTDSGDTDEVTVIPVHCMQCMW